MPERLFSSRRRLLAIAVVAGALMVGAFGLAAWSFVNGHRTACESRNVNLNVLRDLLILTQPKKGLTQPQQAFYMAAFARIDAARC